jgi:HEAT repeat protein/class 3 adenylate cyclase
MFEKSKIKRYLSQYGKAAEGERKELADRLAAFGVMAIPLAADELRYNRMLFADVVEIENRLFKPEYLEEFVRGLGDAKETVRELFRQVIEQKGGRPVVGVLMDHLADDDHMVRNMIARIVIELDPHGAQSTRITPLLRHDNRDVKKTAMDVLSSTKTPGAVAQIMIMFDDADSWLRRKAVEAVCRFRDPTTLPRLREMALKERDPSMLKTVIETIGEIGGPADGDTLLKLVEDPDMTVRNLAIDATAKVADASIAPKVLQLMANPDVNIRRAAVDVLNGVKDPATAGALVNALKDGDWWVREVATDALSELGGGHISQMVRGLLTEADENTRRAAVEFYCRVRDESAYPDLIQLLDDGDWWVREKAVTALGLIGNAEAVPAIARLAADQEVKWAVAPALGKIGGAEAVKPLTAMLSDANRQIRIAAVDAIGRIESNSVVDALKRAALDRDDGVADAALKLLREKTGRVYLPAEIREEFGARGSTFDDEEELSSVSPATMMYDPSNPTTVVIPPAQAKPGDILTEAILVIDVVKSTDYAATYGDHAAMGQINALAQIVGPVAQKRNVQFSKSTGDGMMLTFRRLKDAVVTAFATLDRVRKRNHNAEPHNRLVLRFSVNIGETRVDPHGDRIGLAVNTTFRIEGLKGSRPKIPQEGVDPNRIAGENVVLATETVANELSSAAQIAMTPLGYYELKGLTGLHRVFLLERTAES